MGDDANEILRKFLQLKPEEQLELFTRMSESVISLSDESEDDFSEKLSRRSAELKSGRVEGVAWNRARAELRSGLEQRHAD